MYLMQNYTINLITQLSPIQMDITTTENYAIMPWNNNIDSYYGLNNPYYNPLNNDNIYMDLIDFDCKYPYYNQRKNIHCILFFIICIKRSKYTNDARIIYKTAFTKNMNNRIYEINRECEQLYGKYNFDIFIPIMKITDDIEDKIIINRRLNYKYGNENIFNNDTYNLFRQLISYTRSHVNNYNFNPHTNSNTNTDTPYHFEKCIRELGVLNV